MRSEPLPIRIRAALDAYAAHLRERFGSRIEAVKLFGSWARGDQTSTSDIDVWVLVDGHDDATRRVPFELAIAVLLDSGVDLAPTVMDRAEWDHLVARERRIARDIEAEGIPA